MAQDMLFIYLEKDLKKKLKVHCINKGITIKDLVSKLLTNHLKKAK